MARMKLILTQEVGGLGAPGDVVDVAAGFGRNYLLPRGFAITWTRGGEKQVDLIKRARSAREIRTLEDAQSVAGQLQRLTVRLKRRAGSNGRLFGSVGATDIADAVRAAGGPELDRRKIFVQDPIKAADNFFSSHVGLNKMLVVDSADGRVLGSAPHRAKM